MNAASGYIRGQAVDGMELIAACRRFARVASQGNEKARRLRWRLAAREARSAKSSLGGGRDKLKVGQGSEKPVKE